MKKSIVIFGILGLLAGLGIFFSKFYKPFPYSFDYDISKESDQAKNADILIIGDHFGVYLNGYLDHLSKGLKKRPIIYNWSAKNEGLHRLLYKMRSLKKFPPIIIYHGGSEEFFERRYGKLDALPRKDMRQLDDLKKIQFIEETYHLFVKEFDVLVDMILSQNSKLIVITPPINILKEYKRVCSQTTTPTLNRRADAMELAVKEDRAEIVLKELPKLIQLSPTNTRFHYILGRAYLQLDRYKESIEHFERAVIFDCETWRGHLVFNKIMINKALKAGQQVIDFHGGLQTFFGEKNIFIDEIYPRHIYYRILVDKLVKLLTSII